jgi:glycosyltransferase involved in cell wall biosynthesis
MIESPKISIVFPVYNGEKYLKKAITSVLEQTYKEFEFIICDDCSTDKSIDIVESYSDERIKFLKNTTNQGLFKTLNFMIQESKSEYIRLWAQDDIMKPQCLEMELQFHYQHPEVGMSYCARDLIDKAGKVIFYAPEDETPDVVIPELANQISFYHGSMPGNIANVMLKKSVLSDVGLFREDMRVSGDFEMWVRIMEKYPLGFVRQSLIYLRSHDEQFSRRRGSCVASMRENKEIFDTLMKRLPPQLAKYANTYRSYHHHTQYIHHVIRNILSLDLQIAFESYQEISKFENIFALIPLWVSKYLLRRKIKPSFLYEGVPEKWEILK